MKEIRLSKIVKAMRQTSSEEVYYLNLDNYMIYYVSRKEVHYLDEYRIATVQDSREVRRHSVLIPSLPEKEMMRRYLLKEGITEEMRYGDFEFFLKVKDLKEDYETAKRELYREESIRFSNENEITYIDDLR